MLGFLVMLLYPSASFALPSAAVLARLESGFAPAQAVTATPSGRSVMLCPTTELRFDIIDPVSRAPGFVQARVYEPRRDADRGRARTVLVLPPTGGENVLDQGYANTLCAGGFRAVIVQSWYRQTESKLDMGMHDEGALRALSAIRHVLDWLRPARRTQVGILGTSVGALSSALALGFDPRLNAAALIAGGVGMPEIIARSTEQGAAALRVARMKAFAYSTIEEYVAAMRERVQIEPADFVDFSGPKKVLAFVGLSDVTVPTENQKALVRAFSAESDEFAGDHLQTILNTFARKRARITAFFERNLD